ncbi:MAG TPA: DUF4214 domain-containing protein [Pyrinomonadaceae bacterium]|jgi:hypothetical protein|nr:DUF4214 domain-containing protein [Pyrinomonadaceae bacterium]
MLRRQTRSGRFEASVTRVQKYVAGRLVIREPLIFLAFAALTAVMMWPWILHLRDAVSDRGDAYAIVYWLWWDYHQTFHDPLNLFHATVFYPYQYTMAFTENDYGVALLFFPLFALGLRPITVHSIATFTAFAFAGYGMFRLARTLTGSYGIAWIASLIFAFVPYHFQRLPHLHLIFTGWIPLLLEALVLFARRRTWGSALWLVLAFVMNALTAITWFILTLLPLILSVAFLLAWNGLKRDRSFWIRGATAMLLAAVVLLPFLLPYYYVHKMYGFARNPQDVSNLSAYPIHWLAASERNKLWAGLGGKDAIDEFTLFPGFFPPLLAFAAFFLIKPLHLQSRLAQLKLAFQKLKLPLSARALVVLLDLIAFTFLFVALLTIGYSGIHFRLFGHELFRSTHAVRPLLFCLITLTIRLLVAYPEMFHRVRSLKQAAMAFRANPTTVVFALAGIWGLSGFLGSFGMHLFFHRMLYRYVPLFTSMRAPVRWAMICYVGLALFAGFGAYRVVQMAKRWMPRFPRSAFYAALAMLILFEQRVAPISFVRGEVNPDAIAQRLRETPMSGGVVEFPAEKDNFAYYRYMLRAADHGRPIVTASASFAPPIVQEIETLTRARPIPDKLLDLLEKIPVSYVVVHKSLLKAENLIAIEAFMSRNMETGRIRFINSYGNEVDDLYAVTKVEPNAKEEATHRAVTSDVFVRQQYLDILNREPDTAETQQWVKQANDCAKEAICLSDQHISQDLSLLHSREFQETSGFIFGFYHALLARKPEYSEWQRDRVRLKEVGVTSFAEERTTQAEFHNRYPESLSNSDYVQKLFKAGDKLRTRASRGALLESLGRGKLTRAGVAVEILNNSPAVVDDGEAFVTLCYFVFLKRDPDSQGFSYWLQILNNDSKLQASVVKGFIDSGEYRARVGEP